jgi:methionine--tRNA ligase beta chain
MINFEDFQKLDIKVGTIESVEKVPELDKILKLVIDFGEEKRQIMAGIAKFVENPVDLVGKQVPVIVNLEPRVIRGYESQGMMLVTDENDIPVFLSPEREVRNGSPVR